MPDRTRLHRPPLRLRQPLTEVERFATIYKRAERIGDHDLRASMGDQLVVRERLAQLHARTPRELRDTFARRADQLIELAFWGGIAFALAHLNSPEDEIAYAISKAQEWMT